MVNRGLKCRFSCLYWSHTFIMISQFLPIQKSKYIFVLQSDSSLVLDRCICCALLNAEAIISKAPVQSLSRKRRLLFYCLQICQTHQLLFLQNPLGVSFIYTLKPGCLDLITKPKFDAQKFRWRRHSTTSILEKRLYSIDMLKQWFSGGRESTQMGLLRQNFSETQIYWNCHRHYQERLVPVTAAAKCGSCTGVLTIINPNSRRSWNCSTQRCNHSN